jgi:cytoskeletal protein RodZ
MTDFNPDADIEPEEEIAEDAPEQSSNRVFILVALGLAGLFVIGLICIGLFAFVVLPQQRASRDATAAAIIAANTQAFIDAQSTANPATNTLEPSPTVEEVEPTATEVVILPTDTPVIAVIGDTATSAPTNTAGPTLTPSRTPTRVGGSAGTALAQITNTGTPGTPAVGGGAGATATPTRIGGGTSTGGTSTATVAAGSQTRTPTPTALPDTGFADEVGGPGLFILAIALVVVFFFARQMRLRNT